jgi:hypothetical protein
VLEENLRRPLCLELRYLGRAHDITLSRSWLRVRNQATKDCHQEHEGAKGICTLCFADTVIEEHTLKMDAIK